MSLGNQSSFSGALEPNTAVSQANVLAFAAQQILSKASTATVVKVQAVDLDAKTVDVLPLVNQVDGAGAATPHRTVYSLPFFRLQGGTRAIVIDPVIGDLGIAVFADHDISAVKRTKAQANPGSGRRFSMADGMYFGGVLNADATTYIKFDQDALVVVADTLNATFSGAASLSAGGDLTLAGGDNATLSAGKNAKVTAELVQLGPGGGNLATAPAPAKTLFTNYAGSGPGAVLSNPTAGSAATLAGNLVPSGSIDTGLANLVTMGTITAPEKTQITDALGITNGTPSASLKTANTNLLAHTNRLSGLVAPTAAAQPFLDGVIGLAPGLDLLAGGLLGPASTAIPAASTGLISATSIAAANTYALGIVAYLTGGGTVATVLSTVSGHASTLNGYEPADTAAYASSQGGVAAAGGFLSLVGYAKSTLAPAQAYFAQVCSPSNIDTLQTV